MSSDLPHIVVQPTEVNAARLAARAAIIGAVAGAIVVAISGLITVFLQQGSEDERSRIDFLRQQQQGVYAAMIQSSAEVVTILRRNDPNPPSLEEYNEALERYRAFDTQYNACNLLGSERVRDNARRLRSSLNFLLFLMAPPQQAGDISPLEFSPSLGSPLDPESTLGPDDAFRAYTLDIGRFTEAARVDLGSSG